VLRDKNNIQIAYKSGILKVKYSIKVGSNSSNNNSGDNNNEQQQYVEIKMERSVENEVDHIR